METLVGGTLKGFFWEIAGMVGKVLTSLHWNYKKPYMQFLLDSGFIVGPSRGF